MKLNANNAETIISNDINIHDYLFKSFEFDYCLKKLKIFIDSPKNDNKYCIEFFDVVGINMVSAYYWGKSPHILDWEYICIDNSRIIDQVFQEAELNNYLAPVISEKSKYVETLFTLTSGDRLAVACKEIHFKKA